VSSAHSGSSFGRTLRSRAPIATYCSGAIEALFGAAMFYYVARFVDTPQLERALPQGGSYLPSLSSALLPGLLDAALDTFDRSLEETRDSGTLEHLLVTQLRFLSSPVPPSIRSPPRPCESSYTSRGAPRSLASHCGPRWVGVIAAMLATLLAFSGSGFFRRVTFSIQARIPPSGFFSGVSSVVGGILFPVNILPDWLQVVAHFNPVTYALDAMRAALLGGATVAGCGVR